MPAPFAVISAPPSRCGLTTRKFGKTGVQRVLTARRVGIERMADEHRLKRASGFTNVPEVNCLDVLGLPLTAAPQTRSHGRWVRFGAGPARDSVEHAGCRSCRSRVRLQVRLGVAEPVHEPVLDDVRCCAELDPF